MPVFYQTIGGSVGAVATETFEWSPTVDITGVSLRCTERGGASLTNVLAEVKIGDIPIFAPAVPLEQLGKTQEDATTFDHAIAKGVPLTFKVTNYTGASVTIDITLAYTK